MQNINVILTKPISGTEITNVSWPSLSTLSQSDEVQLNISLVGFESPVACKVSFEFTDGTELTDINFMNSPLNPSIFYSTFTDIFNRHITVGDVNNVKVTNITITDGIVSYTLMDGTYLIPLYKTNVSDTLTPTDLEKLFVMINSIHKRLNALEGN